MKKEQIKEMEPEQVSKEMLKLLRDFPTLNYTGVIDDKGKETGPFTATILLALFRDNTLPVSIIMEQGKNILRSTEKALAHEDENMAFGAVIADISFAEALFQRIQQRTGKLDVWGKQAETLADMLDKYPDISEKSQFYIFAASARWFQKTIDAGQGSINASLDGLARLIYDHHPDDNQDTRESAIMLFTKASANGYVESMNALADLLMTEGTLREHERHLAVQAIKAGAKKKTKGADEVLKKLAAANFMIGAAASPPPPEPQL